MTQEQFLEQLKSRFGGQVDEYILAEHGEITLELPKENLLEVAEALRDEAAFAFSQLIDISGVDYLHYGVSEWETDNATREGFSRGVDRQHERSQSHWEKPRFAAAYHLLSLKQNQRLRLRVFAHGEPPRLPSVIDVWSSANWYEREVFDLYGILFEGHPDLRRILTDYGFIGHPFRKDFPVSGHIEMRYDAAEKRVIYEPVNIEPRTLVPKVIRHDNRYGANAELMELQQEEQTDA